MSIVSWADMDRGKQLKKIQTIDITLDSIETVLIDNSDLKEIQFIQRCNKISQRLWIICLALRPCPKVPKFYVLK